MIRAAPFAAATALALAVPASAFAHGDRVPVSELGSAWLVEPFVIALAAVATALYAQAFVRLRRRGRRDHASWWHAFLFALGLGIAVLAVVSPLDAIAEEYLLSGHMLEHGLIGDFAPALIILAVSGPILFFLLPPVALRPLARARPLHTILGFLTRPLVAFCVWALVYAVWHVPALYDYVLTARWAHDLQHACFLLAGVLVWYVLVDPARRGTVSRSGRLGFALAIFAAGQVLSMVLVFAFDPLYPAYAAQDERLLGLSPLTDQRLAGVVMMVEQVITLGTCAAFLLLAADRETRDAAEAAAAEAGELAPEPEPEPMSAGPRP